ncbi:MAG: GerMN domain-containing protein, partial [Frankiaceae bacterium]|nr:GerMN domain-containing protein [Frankiaceae bacterium]
GGPPPGGGGGPRGGGGRAPGGGPPPPPPRAEAGIRSALPTTFAVESVEVGRNGVAVVTLGGESTQISTSPLGFAQVVATLTVPGRARAVRFRLDGEDLPVPRGDTSLAEEPVDRSDYAELLALGTPAPSPPPVTEPPGSPAPG